MDGNIVCLRHGWLLLSEAGHPLWLQCEALETVRSLRQWSSYGTGMSHFATWSTNIKSYTLIRSSLQTEHFLVNCNEIWCEWFSYIKLIVPCHPNYRVRKEAQSETWEETRIVGNERREMPIFPVGSPLLTSFSGELGESIGWTLKLQLEYVFIKAYKEVYI